MCANLLQLCLILFDPLDVSPSGFSSMGFSRQEYWSGFPCPPPGISFWSRDQTHISCVSCIDRWVLYHKGHFRSPNVAISSVQSFSHVQLFATPWIAARQASLFITNSQSSLKLMPIESVMLSSHLILCHPLLLLPPIPPSITVSSNKSTLRMRWPKYWSFSFSISSSDEHPGLISSGWTGWISLQSKGLSRVFSNITVQKHQFFGAQLSSQSNSHNPTWSLEKP